MTPHRPTVKTDNVVLAAEDLHKSLGRGAGSTHVLRGLSLTVRRGEFLAVMGPSGCGKSTLLHVLGLMTHADTGSLSLLGRAVGPSRRQRTALRRRDIGFVFQRFNLLDVLTAADNVIESMKVRGLGRDARRRADELFNRLGIAHVAGRKPGQMSIGEQQRVAVARGLAHRPALLLADEPTGNLDSANSRALLELLREINQADGQTILMITHSPEAAAAADRVLHMADGTLTDGEG